MGCSLQIRPSEMNSSAPPLSLCMIVLNEERHLARCLGSVKSIAGQMVVVDTGSTDSTKKIAADCGAEIFDFAWNGDFAAARNASLSHATGRWILVLDADEYLPPASMDALQLLIQTPADRAFHLLNKSTNDGGKSGMTGKIVRLFPNRPDVRYEWPVHEQVVTSLRRTGIPVLDSDIEIFHTGYSDAETNKLKQARNLEILERSIAAGPCDPMLLFLAGGAYLDLGRIEEALAAYRNCAERTSAGDEIFEAARVRQVTCLMRLERPQEAIALTPNTAPSNWHPELLEQLGKCAFAVGDFQRGLEWLHTSIAAPFKPWIPAHDPVKTKVRALQHIASALQNADPRRALALLRLAVECAKAGREPQLDEVLALEQAP